MVNDDILDGIAARIRKARLIAVVTGAGISAESGIRTFRDTMEGLWKDFDPQKLATPEAFAADPELVSRWYEMRRQGCLAAEPNAGHLALAALEQHMADRGGRFVLLTQNVDGLHQRAGSRKVVELHGSIHVWRCMATGKEVRPDAAPFTTFPPSSPWVKEPGQGKTTRGMLRPGVVWFGESLPVEAVRAADEAAESCDVFFSVGTSAVVYPAAGFIEQAGENGALTVEINKDVTPISRRVDFSVRGSAGEVLPRLLSRLSSAGGGDSQRVGAGG